ncbi:MAG: AmmeMemoRadiSam system protein B [Deltaproteobacteria bacterium]|nr:AmmeMemoRadiSam system protein B [Deltaproteobacteria bacterium]
MNAFGDLLPRLRYVETIPVDVDGRKLVAVKDPQRYATAMLTVEQGALYILSKCDGRTTLGDLAREWEEQTGRPLPAEDVARLIKVFDDHFFLETPHFDAHKRAVDSAWMNAPIRPSTLFDYAEPGKEKEAWDELRRMINDFYRAAGHPPGPEIVSEKRTAKILVAPHIDYQRGGKVWAAAYGEFARSFTGRRVIILGTNHQPHKLPVSMTAKNFQTPFGLLLVDEELSSRIAAALPFDPYEDELPHRVEHSVELAAVMLAYLRPDIRIVPVLLGGAQHLVDGKDDPETDEAFLALAEAVPRYFGRRRRRRGADRLGRPRARRTHVSGRVSHR